MDIAAGISAGRRANGRVATVAIDSMKFIRPVKIGDVLCVYSDIERIGRTSIAIHLEAWVLQGRTGARVKVTDALFTFVAIGPDGAPRLVPPSAET
jgi:acyl-CoA thioesterase YciA